MTFNMLLGACCRLQLHDRLYVHLESMRALSLMPNATTVTQLLTHFSGDRQQLEQALRTVQEAAQAAPQPH